jgi:hypothetical protein
MERRCTSCVWTSVRTPLHQLRTDLGRFNENCVAVTFQIDTAGVVTGLDLAVHGKKDNAVMVDRLEGELRAYYTKKYRPTSRCEMGSCVFDLPDAKQQIVVTYHNLGDELWREVTVHLEG